MSLGDPNHLGRSEVLSRRLVALVVEVFADDHETCPVTNFEYTLESQDGCGSVGPLETGFKRQTRMLCTNHNTTGIIMK